MPSTSPGELDARILALLPTDGTPVLNRVMRVMLTREMQSLVGQDDYFAARDRLFEASRIGRRRGQGGQIFLLPAPLSDEPPSKPPVPVDAWPEAALMQPLDRYLRGTFAKGLDIGDGVRIVQDTSALGPRQGLWARPDFILVTAMRFRLLPGVQVDVHAFELKTESGGTVQAVHEALAQTRFTHFGHLVWHLPSGSRAEARLAEIATHCEAHGIGLIRLRDPNTPETGEILVDPKRMPTRPAMIDGFLESRLLPENRGRLEAVVREVRAWPAS